VLGVTVIHNYLLTLTPIVYVVSRLANRQVLAISNRRLTTVLGQQDYYSTTVGGGLS
jgi:hypothetical protein